MLNFHLLVSIVQAVIYTINAWSSSSPMIMEIQVGDSVQFTFSRKWQSVTQTYGLQSCTKMDLGFDSKMMSYPSKYDLTFSKAGNYYYMSSTPHECSNGMTGVIQVTQKSGDKDCETIVSKQKQILETSSTQSKPNYNNPAKPTQSYDTLPNSSTSKIHEIQVAPNGTLIFALDKITINTGDSVSWKFGGKEHTVTQTINQDNCTKMSNGFDSGKMVSPQTFVQKFDQAGKIYYICTVGNHCSMGMKGMIDVIGPAQGLTTHLATTTAVIADTVTPAVEPYPSPSNSSTSKIHEIQVAPNGTLIFALDKITINAGDSVSWKFGGKEHTVTQTINQDNCTKMSNGFDSGKMVSPQTFVQKFDQAGKIYYICTVGNHCSMGMKGMIDVIGPAQGLTTHLATTTAVIADTVTPAVEPYPSPSNSSIATSGSIVLTPSTNSNITSQSLTRIKPMIGPFVVFTMVILTQL